MAKAMKVRTTTSILLPSGMKIGSSATKATMTTISGTPRQNSIKPVQSFRMTGSSD